MHTCTDRAQLANRPKRWLPLFAVAIALSGGIFQACAKVGSSTANAPDPAPQKTADAPPPSLDLSVDELSPNGCLDLELASARFGQFPDGAAVREYTKSFEMANQSIDGKALPRMRNMAAETAFANFSFDEKPATLYAAELPAVVQTECSTVEMTDRLNGKESYVVVPDSTKSSLHLKTPDGLKERTYLLKSAREIEITYSAPRVDRCPDFLKALATTVRSRVWGTQSDLNSVPPTVALDLLKKVSVAVLDVPTGILGLLRSETDVVTPTAADLRSLKTAVLDPQIVACPFDATPPSGDEPPPPEETPSPTPSPAPVPMPPPAH